MLNAKAQGKIYAGIWEVRGGPFEFVYSKVMRWVAYERMKKSQAYREYLELSYSLKNMCLSELRTDERAYVIKNADKIQINYQDYDWRLNRY